MKTQLQEFESVQFRICDEGFDYTFTCYSDWGGIDDEEFHKLRNNYLKSMKKLEDYVNNKVEELSV